jgi:hypothetical protein
MATRRSAGTGARQWTQTPASKRIARKNGDGFAGFLAGRLPAKVVVSRAKVVMNRRIGVNKFDGAGWIVRCQVAVEMRAVSGEMKRSACRQQTRYTAWLCEWRTAARTPQAAAARGQRLR